VNARILNNGNRNIGNRTCISITPKAASNATPPASEPSTTGLVQPIVWAP
jgi:hypothetical protein